MKSLRDYQLIALQALVNNFVIVLSSKDRQAQGKVILMTPYKILEVLEDVENRYYFERHEADAQSAD